MRKKNNSSQPRFVTESLEPRLLLAGTPWGAFPQLIQQDLAVTSYAAYNGSGQTIAIIDTGVDYTHPALSGKYLGGYDFVSNDTNPMDRDGHGTGVAGIAVGKNFIYNGAQYQGIAPGARIVALRVDNNRVVPEDRYKAAFDWILANRLTYNITVVNASFGDGHYATEAQRSTYAPVMKQLADLGVFIVAASGNDGAISPYGIEYPGADPSVFSAGAINASDLISTFTERGPIMDILAPGENVPTSYLDQTTKAHIYYPATGTSFAAPFIAGAAAILKQIDPTFTPHEIMSILRASGVDNFDGDGEAGATTQFTYSSFDMYNAIRLGLQRKSGGANALVGVNGQDNVVKYDRDGILYWAWYDASTTDLKFATRDTGGDWSTIQTIDTAGNVGLFVSMAITSTGKPAVAYYDATNADLKYAMWDGGRWNVQTIDSKNRVGMYPSLAFDQYDDPIITYYYRSGGDLRYAVDIGQGFGIGTIDSTGDVGRCSSLALSNTGIWSVAYEDTSTGKFKFARKPGKYWGTGVFDNSTRVGGGYISLAYDHLDRPNVTYYDAWNADLKFAQFAGGVWNLETVASQFSQGLYTNLLVDDDNVLDIIYFNKSFDAVYRARGTFSSWTITQLAAGGGRLASTARFDSTEQVFTRYHTASADLLLDSY